MTDALIGPNAIIQVVEAIRRELGPERLQEIMHKARLAHYLADAPQCMVSELDVARLHRAVAAGIPVREGCAIMAQAGHHTALYLLAHRIPRMAQMVLRALPAAIAARLLLKAIARHAWTFAGSSRFEHGSRHPVRISLTGSPLFATAASRTLAAAYFEAAFETLFRQLVSSRTIATAPSQPARQIDAGGKIPACVFDLCWTG
jgi:divinyl protochlorophyllide a 8-vinyl-reductase